MENTLRAIPFNTFEETEFSCQILKFFSCSVPVAIQLMLFLEIITLKGYRHYTVNLRIFKQKMSALYLNFSLPHLTMKEKKTQFDC